MSRIVNNTKVYKKVNPKRISETRQNNISKLSKLSEVEYTFCPLYYYWSKHVGSLFRNAWLYGALKQYTLKVNVMSHFNDQIMRNIVTLRDTIRFGTLL